MIRSYKSKPLLIKNSASNLTVIKLHLNKSSPPKNTNPLLPKLRQVWIFVSSQTTQNVAIHSFQEPASPKFVKYFLNNMCFACLHPFQPFYTKLQGNVWATTTVQYGVLWNEHQLLWNECHSDILLTSKSKSCTNPWHGMIVMWSVTSCVTWLTMSCDSADWRSLLYFH